MEAVMDKDYRLLLDAIQEYFAYEFDNHEPVTMDCNGRVGVAYTEDQFEEDGWEYHFFQVYVDVFACSLVYEIDGEEVQEKSFSSYEDLARYIEWDNMIGDCCGICVDMIKRGA